MKTAFTFLLLFSCFISVLSQSANLNDLLTRISKEKSDSARFYLAFSGLTTSETNPVLDMKNAEVILVHGEKNNDPVCQVLGLGCLGYDYRAFGNTAKSLEYNLKARVIAEKTTDSRLLGCAYVVLAPNYMDLGDYAKATSYGRHGLEYLSRVEPHIMTIAGNLYMGEIYLNTNKLDSALYFTQRAYEITMTTGLKEYLCGIYSQLGAIQIKLKNSKLAVSYLDLALKESYRINSPKYISISYTAFADYYLSVGQRDSAIFFAKKAIATVKKTAFSTMTIKPSKLLLDIYRKSNIDSAFKYAEMNKAGIDSLFSIKAVQQAQLMTFEEDARQHEVAIQHGREESQRKQNIQYALTALVIIALVIVFMILSRSFIANPKLISFFCVVALIVVFEFLNLLLGPFLERITGNTPWLMLGALVCIASLLAPIHHRLEKWTTQKLVEKNKLVRLASARKTIEELEG